MFAYAFADQLSTPVCVLTPWRDDAIAAAHRAAVEAVLSLRAELAARVSRLTGIPVAPDLVYADNIAGIATVTVDGATFRLAQGRLTLLRPCAACGTGQFASPSINGIADLGRALDAWDPLHDDCQPEDSTHWLYRDDA